MNQELPQIPPNSEEMIKHLFTFLKEGFNNDLLSAALAVSIDGRIKILIGLASDSGEFMPTLEVLDPMGPCQVQPRVPPTAH